MSAHAWRIDRVARAAGGAVVRVDEGAPTLDYEKACGEFDARAATSNFMQGAVTCGVVILLIFFITRRRS
jgi:hypothetical protein